MVLPFTIITNTFLFAATSVAERSISVNRDVQIKHYDGPRIEKAILEQTVVGAYNRPIPRTAVTIA